MPLGSDSLKLVPKAISGAVFFWAPWSKKLPFKSVFPILEKLIAVKYWLSGKTATTWLIEFRFLKKVSNLSLLKLFTNKVL